MKLNNITLEISGKPFRDESDETLYRECGRMFRQWKRLTDNADGVSVMLWISDGSEILSYSGDCSDRFEWAYWIGCAEPLPRPENPTERFRRNTHYYPKKYIPEAAPRPYSWLKRLIEVIRETCLKINEKNPRIVAIFDNGPEFALSDFKYRLHPEIAKGSTVGMNRSVVCNSNLHADHRKYAAFPNGIPEGISLGSFLGAQFRVFAKDFGYDAIWLSNGMGFGRDPWGITGFLFDKENFTPEASENARETMLGFWQDFAKACPGMCIETRGSNFSAGVEMSTDGAPLRELYRDYKIAPPVNSPWAALNFNSGLEIAAWMSHVAELPDERFPFRFYPHDPWFLNSPWLDRYGREPWDIYLPLSISRVREDGTVQTPNRINILTVDDSYGNMPDQVPDEVTPHLLEAVRTAPDAIGPFLWVYPFETYYEMVHGKEKHPETVFNEDLFLGETIQGGFPLNTVVSQENFAKIKTKAIVVMPVSAFDESAEKHLAAGGKIIFYGSLTNAPAKLWKILGLKIAAPVSGTVKAEVKMETDQFKTGAYAETIHLMPVFDGGPLTEAGDGAKILAEAAGRVLASVNGSVAFLRSVLPLSDRIDRKNRDLDRKKPDEVFPVENLLRHLAAAFGWEMKYSARNVNSMLPRMNISRHENAFYFSVFARDTTAVMRIKTPVGAPIPDEMETELEKDGCAVWHPGKCWHKRCRCFVDQKTDSIISSKVSFAAYPEYVEQFAYQGFQNADLRIFAPEESLEKLEFVRASQSWSYLFEPMIPYEIEENEFGKCAVVKNFTGNLYIGVLK